MPLLALPNEILNEIIHYVFTDGPPTPEESNWHLLNIVRFAHTCRHIRSLSIPSIYTDINCTTRTVPAIHSLLSSSNCALYVRSLGIPVRYAPYQQSADNPGPDLLQEIIRRCPRLEQLVLVQFDPSRFENNDFNKSLLGGLTPERKLAIKKLGFGLIDIAALIPYFNQLSDKGKGSDFCRLRKLSISCSMGASRTGSSGLYRLAEARRFKGRVLASVDSLVIRDTHPTMYKEVTGGYIGRMVPNITRLFLEDVSAKSVIGILKAYNKYDSRLKYLTICFKQGTYNTYHDICTLVAGISTGLEIFILRGATICENLFTGLEAWPRLRVLDIRCDEGCEDVNPNLVWEGFERITQSRPEVSIFVAAGSQCLASWNWSSGPKGWRGTEGWVPKVNLVFSSDVFRKALSDGEYEGGDDGGDEDEEEEDDDDDDDDDDEDEDEDEDGVGDDDEEDDDIEY